MEKKILILKENQQMLGNKITMLQETNKKKDEEADRIRELIAECRENLNRIKCEAFNSDKRKVPCEGRPEFQSNQDPDCSQKRSKCPSGEERQVQSTREVGRDDGPCRKFRSVSQPQSLETPCGGKPDDPCTRFRTSALQQPCGNQKGTSGSKTDEPCTKYLTLKSQEFCEKSNPQESNHSPYGKATQDPYGITTTTPNGAKGPCESPTSTIRAKISAIANAQEKSRQCIEKLEEKLEAEVKMTVAQGSSNGYAQFHPCEYDSETLTYQERVSCKVDLGKMKVNIKGPPEDLKKLDAVQLINLLDRFQCQELVINTGDNDSQIDLRREVPVFHITHPGNLALIVGVVMVAFLVNANLCSPRRSCRTKLLLNMLYLGSFAFHYGIVLWMSFIRGLTLSVGLPRDIFNTVDNLILPKYFAICVFLSAITLYSFLATHCMDPCTSWPITVVLQVIIESTTFLTELITICYIVPAIVKLREVTDEFTMEDEDSPPPESYCRNMEKLARLNRTVTLINTLTVMFMGSNMYYISSRLNIG